MNFRSNQCETTSNSSIPPRSSIRSLRYNTTWRSCQSYDQMHARRLKKTQFISHNLWAIIYAEFAPCCISFKLNSINSFKINDICHSLNSGTYQAILKLTVSFRLIMFCGHTLYLIHLKPGRLSNGQTVISEYKPENTTVKYGRIHG